MVKNLNKEDTALTSNEVGSYFISAKGKYAVIAFSGILDRKALNIFEEISHEIFTLQDACFYILCFAGVTRFSPVSAREISKLQSSIRERGFLLRVCGFNFRDQKKFLEDGVIRRQELKRSIADAIKGIIKAKKNKEAKLKKSS
jgi:hypothetical protein